MTLQFDHNVTFRYCDKCGEIKTIVEDSGIGISENDQI